MAIFCDRPHLHVDTAGQAPFPPYMLDEDEKKRLLECVKHAVKFPDGYASDLANCVDLENNKFSGMKSHDCHVFMERLLPFIFSELLDQNVHLALSAVGVFFRDLCSRTLQKNHVQMLKRNIVLIICNLEKIFPPSFFDVMQHLPIHLPYEAELGGPVQYRWMYVFERNFKKLKAKAKNKRFAAGSIVESYINDEIAYFSEHYFVDHIQTKSWFTRFHEGEVPVYHVPGVPDIFTHVGRPSGEMQEIWLSEKDYRCAHAYVLRNCDYFHPFERMFEDFLTAKYADLSEKDLSAKRADEYQIWVKDYKHGEGRKTCNYGVSVKGESYTNASDEADYYGILTDIIQIQYEGSVDLKITLFKCKWYDPLVGRGTRRSNGGIVDVLSSRKYHKYEPFILASQADHVCYIPYPYVKKPKHLWLNVLKVNPRGIISGEYENKEPTLLQQVNDDAVLMTTVEDLAVDHLVYARVQPINLDVDVEDVEQDDEFQCNISSSDEDGEVPY
ncbi:uncharacterized protein LOC125608146 [Brassica napus]|uniref:uncharacterized protein LOC125608146 n=1 Tax=Brassica napus TaxID=3708 RepID=UPI0020789279|nr:uncharacterized protein LOC125608146 [Brassica napus]